MATVGTNSYISTQSFKDWAALFGHDITAYLDSDIEAASVRSAINFIETEYDFKGTVVDEAQAMQLPTNEVAIADINNGAAQALWQDLKGFLFVAMDSQSVNGDVKSESKGLGSLKKSVEYMEGTANTATYSTTVIDSLMRPFLDVSATGFNSYRVL